MHGLNCFHHVWKTARREWDYKWKITFFKQVKLFPFYSILCIINTRWVKSNLHLPLTVELLKIIWYELWLCTLVRGGGNFCSIMKNSNFDPGEVVGEKAPQKEEQTYSLGYPGYVRNNHTSKYFFTTHIEMASQKGKWLENHISPPIIFVPKHIFSFGLWQRIRVTMATCAKFAIISIIARCIFLIKNPTKN